MPEARQQYQPKIAGKNRQTYARENFSSGDFTYPGKLVFNEVTESQSTGKAAGLHQWEQHIEEQHRAFPDGNPGRQFNRVLLQDPRTGGVIFQGSDADQLAQAYEEACGCDCLPDNPDSAEYVGHCFMYKSVAVPGTERTDDQGRTRSLYRQVPVEYLGPDYTYDGEVQTIGGSAPEPVEDTPDDSNATAPVVAALDGMTEEDARGGAMLELVKQDGVFAGIKTVLGVSLRGGFTPPRAILLDKLVAAGHVSIQDGVIKAAE